MIVFFPLITFFFLCREARTHNTHREMVFCVFNNERSEKEVTRSVWGSFFFSFFRSSSSSPSSGRQSRGGHNDIRALNKEADCVHSIPSNPLAVPFLLLFRSSWNTSLATENVNDDDEEDRHNQQKVLLAVWHVWQSHFGFFFFLSLSWHPD